MGVFFMKLIPDTFWRNPQLCLYDRKAVAVIANFWNKSLQVFDLAKQQRLGARNVVDVLAHVMKLRRDVAPKSEEPLVEMLVQSLHEPRQVFKLICCHDVML